MRYYKGISDAGQENFKAWPYTGNLSAYAAVRVDTTTPSPSIVAVTTVGTSFLGVTNEPTPYSSALPWSTNPVIPGFDPGPNGTVALGTTGRIACHVHRPGDLYEAEVDQTTTVAATGGTGTTITTASNDAGLGGAYVYIVGGTGRGQLRYVASSIANTSLTLPAAGAWTTNPDATSTFIVIRPRFSTDIVLATGGVNALGEPLASGSTNVFKLHEAWVEHVSLGRKELTPIGSSNVREPGLQSLGVDFDLTNTPAPRFYLILAPVDPFYN